jgi:opacity protein-like surface antigen
MKKILIIVSVILMISTYTSNSYAQFSIGAKAGVAMPVGSFGQFVNMGFGGMISATYSINDKIEIGFNTGMYVFKGTDFPVDTKPSANVMPVVADFKFYLSSDGFKPYAGLGLGMFLTTNSITTPAKPAEFVGGALKSPATNLEIHKTSSAKFGVAPSLGFMIGDELKWGACVIYNITFSDANFVSINFGISYPIGK